MVPIRQDSATFNMTCLLREWDRAPRERRRQLLQDFIDQHWNRSGPELELEMAQMASLFLARICVWVKLTYMSGTCLTEQLQVLYIFLSAASSHNFLAEFLQNGGILCLQELCVLPNAKEIDKYWALRVLSCVANGGTRYKETICECYGIRAVAECMAKSNSEKTQEAARDVLEQLAEGNPRFRDQVYKGLIAVLPCDSAKAQQLALESIRILQTGNPVANRALIDRVNCILESLHFSVQAAETDLKWVNMKKDFPPGVDLGPFHKTVQALELVRTLMHCDIADDILKALVGLLHPQREIELGKLFNQAAKSVGSEFVDSSSDEDDEDEVNLYSGVVPASVSAGGGGGGGGTPEADGGGEEANEETDRVDTFTKQVRDFSGRGVSSGGSLSHQPSVLTINTVLSGTGVERGSSRLMLARPSGQPSSRAGSSQGSPRNTTTSTAAAVAAGAADGAATASVHSGHSGASAGSGGPAPSVGSLSSSQRHLRFTASTRSVSKKASGRRRKTASSSARRLRERERAESNADEPVVLPTPAFVQQASAAKCICVLIGDSAEWTRRLLSFGALSGLLYAMGNMEYPDSQRQSSLAVKLLCEKYAPIRTVVAEVMGQALYEDFFNRTDKFYLHMTPLQADLLVSSKTKFAGIDEIDLDESA